jgi:hypothetical protein
MVSEYLYKGYGFGSGATYGRQNAWLIFGSVTIAGIVLKQPGRINGSALLHAGQSFEHGKQGKPERSGGVRDWSGN